MAQISHTPHDLGRYRLSHEIGAGGMATVHLGRLMGPVGFARTVAIKRLHPQFSKDPEFVSMFLDEARLAARIRHPNVVSTLDVVASRGELYLVMDYVQGASLSQLLAATRGEPAPMPASIASAIVVQTLLGLHAAHEARNDLGELLEVVHRDLSPHNILVGEDGVTRVADFGVAKAAARTQTTHKGQLKGKLTYMSPEQVMARAVDRRTDLFTAGVVLWECLTNEKLFTGEDPAAIMASVIGWQARRVSLRADLFSAEAARVLMRSLAHEPEARYSTAMEMARELAAAIVPADALAVGDWMHHTIPELLAERSRVLAEFESSAEMLRASTHLLTPTVGLLAQARPSLPTIDPAETELETKVDRPAAAPTPKPPPKTPPRRRWAVVGVLLLGAVLAGLWSRSCSPEPSIARETLSEPKTTSTYTEEAAPLKSQVPSTLGSNSMARGPSDKGELTTPPGQAEAQSPAPQNSAIRSRGPRARATRPKCDPPYKIRSDGLKEYRPECL